MDLKISKRRLPSLSVTPNVVDANLNLLLTDLFLHFEGLNMKVKGLPPLPINDIPQHLSNIEVLFKRTIGYLYAR